MPSVDLSLKLASPLLDYLVAHRGAEILDALAASTGLAAASLRAASAWVSHADFERLLAAARSHLQSDEEFEAACAYSVDPRRGSARLLLAALGPREAYDLGARHLRLHSGIGEASTQRDGEAVVVRYTSDKEESRLMCLSRQARLKQLPVMWNLPPAQLEELACIARGGDACIYRLRVYERRRWLPVMFGLAVGGALALAARALGADDWFVTVALSVGGGAIALLLELARALRLNSATARELSHDYLEMARTDAAARREILELTQRQHEWIHRLEERELDAADARERLNRGIEAIRSRWEGSIRGFSHDLRSPLAVIKMNVSYLREIGAVQGAEGSEILDDLDAGVERMEQLLGELKSLAALSRDDMRLAPEAIFVPGLTEQLRARLGALVVGRGLDTSVLASRDAPELIVCDRVLLDRVLDSLMTNACTRTERGSIAVEVGGTPGFLTIKLSDTGAGLDEARLTQILERSTSGQPPQPGAEGWDVGLSVAVPLLARIGGRVEVMSKPEVGTTFWVHLPLEIRGTLAPRAAQAPDELAEVVSVRRLKIG